MMEAYDRVTALQEERSGKQKLLADLAKNKQLADMRQRELNQNYQMHKDGLALKNKELMQNLHTNYFNISSGAVKGVAENTKGDTTKENLYASIADNFSENNMGFLGKAFFKGLAIKERGQRETKEAEEKRKVYEDYLNKYGDVIQYLSATNKYAQDLMARQQVKDQAEQEVRSVIDEVGKKNLTEGQSQAAIAQAANNASKKLGEPVIFAGIRQGDGAIIFQDEKGQTVFVENPYYLGQLERQNQNQANVRPNQLDLPNTTPIRFGNRQQQQQSQEPMPQQQQMPNEHQQQQQTEPDYRGMKFEPNATIELPGWNGNPVKITLDDKGKVNGGHELLSDSTLEKLAEAGHVAKKPGEPPKALMEMQIKGYDEAVTNIEKEAERIKKIDRIIANSDASYLQGMPDGVAAALKWLIPGERQRLSTLSADSITALLEPLRKLMSGIWTDQDFNRMMAGAWSIDKPPESVKEIMESAKKATINQIRMHKNAFLEGRKYKEHLETYDEQEKQFAPIFDQYLNQPAEQAQTTGQSQGVKAVKTSRKLSDDGRFFIFSVNQ